MSYVLLNLFFVYTRDGAFYTAYGPDARFFVRSSYCWYILSTKENSCYICTFWLLAWIEPLYGNKAQWSFGQLNMAPLHKRAEDPQSLFLILANFFLLLSQYIFPRPFLYSLRFEVLEISAPASAPPCHHKQIQISTDTVVHVTKQYISTHVVFTLLKEQTRYGRLVAGDATTNNPITDGRTIVYAILP